ncbi:MAG: ion transporter [Bacteroidota bacterium]
MTKKKKIKLSKEKILKTIDKAEQGDQTSRIFDIFIMTLIILNVIAVIVETVEPIYQQYKDFFYYFELVSVIIFTIEYAIRVWICTAIEKYKHPIKGRLKYILSIEAIIDLLAIIPFYLPLLFGIDARFIRVLRIFRLFRIFKLGRYSTAFQMIKTVIKDRTEELVITFTMVIIMLIFSSSMMYYIEHEVQPEAFKSIPDTMWWGVATLTTVGYGDVYPITPLGKLLGAFIAILGIGVFALPAGIIASGFEAEMSKMDEYKKRNNKNKEQA